MSIPVNLVTRLLKDATIQEALTLCENNDLVPEAVKVMLQRREDKTKKLSEIAGVDWLSACIEVFMDLHNNPTAERASPSVTQTQSQESVIVQKCPKCNKFFLNE